LNENRRRQLSAAQRAWEEQAEQSALEQGSNDGFRKLTAPLDFIGRCVERGP
jgi:hypothetical protein